MMKQIRQDFSSLRERVCAERWQKLCESYLPVQTENSIWRLSREAAPHEPQQGWKIHLSATILEACDLFAKIAPVLVSQNVQFKAPVSLEELAKINCGLQYGYTQVGKFITVYPTTTRQAQRLAAHLHELTREFTAVSVPFDEQYLPKSSVFYRYGSFVNRQLLDDSGKSRPVIEDLTGRQVFDDRFRAIPEWLTDPFQTKKKKNDETAETLLMTKYKIFQAVTQRGKGGTYYALDISVKPLRICIVKEGRQHGELHWNGQDGQRLVKNEFAVLRKLGKINCDVPQVYESFEAEGNFYVAMEYVEGKSLYDLMKIRRKRFSIRKVVELAIEISRVIAGIHRAGWIWNDCKPANLIVTKNSQLRPVDFENSFRQDQKMPFDWSSDGFSNPHIDEMATTSNDLYALGAVVYFLLTAKLYRPRSPVAIKKLRRRVPLRLEKIIENLLGKAVTESKTTALEMSREFEEVLISMTSET